MIGAVMILPLLGFCLWLSVTSVKQRPRDSPARTRRPTARPMPRTRSRTEPEWIESPVTKTPMPAWTEMDELQLIRLLRDETPPAAPGAVR